MGVARGVLMLMLVILEKSELAKIGKDIFSIGWLLHGLIYCELQQELFYVLISTAKRCS